MSDTIKLKRTSSITSPTVQNTKLQDGEPLYDKTHNALYIGDGTNTVSDLNPIAGGSTLIAGNGINITDNTISVKNNTSGGLTTSNDGVAINLETTKPGLKITSNKLNTKISSSGGLTTDTDGLEIKTQTNPGLTIDSNGVKVKPGNGITVDSSGVNVKGNANKAIEVDSTNGVGIVLASTNNTNTSGLSFTNGLKVNVDNNNGLSIDNNTIKMAVATSSQLGTVKVQSNNGLTFNNDTIAMSTATTTVAGVMSSTDKQKLDGITSNATKVIPQANSYTSGATNIRALEVTSGNSISKYNIVADKASIMTRANSNDWATWTTTTSNISKGIWLIKFCPEEVQSTGNEFYYGLLAQWAGTRGDTSTVSFVQGGSNTIYEIGIDSGRISYVRYKSIGPGGNWSNLTSFILKASKIIELP